MSAVLFFIFAILAIVGAIGVVTLRNPLYAVLSLVGHLVSLAALFLLLRAEFVAAAQVVVYAGAVMVLYVFVVAYIGDGHQLAPGGRLRLLGPIFALALAVEMFIAMFGSALEGIGGKGAHYRLGFGTPEHIGKLFLTDYLFPFEVASLLLLVAAVGAIVLARRRRGLDDDRDALQLRDILAAPRPSYTGTIAEGAGVRRVRELMDEAHGGAIEVTTRAAAKAAAAGATPGGRCHGHDRRLRRGRGAVMSLGWYLAVSVLIFCIGAGGVLVRRNPLVILLCLELMLNAANLALVTFARLHGGEAGQIFALIVMVVAACEVTVGLGLLVAISRRNLPIDVDELHELNG